MSVRDGPLGAVYSEEDAAVPSGESSALALFAALARRSPDLRHERRARALLAALAGAMSGIPTLRTTALAAAALLDGGETGPVRAMGNGAVRAAVERRPGGLHLLLGFADGWHANAHEPGNARLVGASLSGAEVAWPPGRELRTRFADAPIRVYEGELALALDEVSGNLELRLQVCSETLCLQPESTLFRITDVP